MADLASYTDVEDSWRSLTPPERVVAESEIKAASADIRLALPDIDTRIAAETALGGTTPLGDMTTAIVTRAVRRYLRARNPQDPSQYGGPLVTEAEIDMIREGYAVASAGEPVGAFPDLVDYPVY